jgi:DNA-binding MarR family transcriptional regulator
MRSNADVRVALDAFRRIVQALRTPGRTARTLSHAQLFALQQIAEHPRSSINDVAALTFTHQSSVSVVVRRLVQRRLVLKVAAREDRRRQHLVLTPRGRDVLRRAPSAVPERLIAAIAALPSTDRRTLAKGLGRIATAVAPGNGSHPPMFLEGRTSRSVSRTSRSPRRMVRA